MPVLTKGNYILNIEKKIYISSTLLLHCLKACKTRVINHTYSDSSHRIRKMSKLCLYLTFALVLCLFAANSSANPKPKPTDIEIIINRMNKVQLARHIGRPKSAVVKGTYLFLNSMARHMCKRIYRTEILSFLKNSLWNLKFSYLFILSPLCMNEESSGK